MTEGPREVGYFAAQWRKLRNPPPPVLRAVLANLAVAILLGVGAALAISGVVLQYVAMR